MKPKSKCSNCGAKLEVTYAINGVMVMFCPHVSAHVVKTGIGNLRHMEIYCHNFESVPSDLVQRSTAIYEYPKEAMLNAKTESLKASFLALTKDSEITFEDLKQSVNATVSDDKLLEYANLAIMLELPLEQLPQLFSAAMRLGYATGISTQRAIQSLTIGIGRQSRLVLDNIGIMFKAKNAYAWFQKEHGSEDFDRIVAWKAYAIKLVKEKSELLTTVSQSKKKRLEQLHAHLRNARNRFGEKVLQQ